MNTASSTGRCLTIQSHVVSGYVGNKCAVFPLQLHGFDVDPILSVQFSNHTGYGSWKGEVMTGEQLQSIVEGLESNGLLEGYTHVLTGYIGSASMLRTVARLVRKLRALNPALVYVCDPVLGDNGKLYVPAELVGIYRDDIVPLATMLTPNQFEAELLTGVTIATESDALGACQALHEAGPASVVLTSLDLEEDADEPTDGGDPADDTKKGLGNPHLRSHQSHITLLGSTSTPQLGGCSKRFRIVVPRIPSYFTGTGDLCAALLLAWSAKIPDRLGSAAEKAVASLQGVLRRTAAAQAEAEASGKSGIGCRELRLVQSVDELLRPEVDEGARVAWLE
jgi:pyridoxine kinase